MQDKEQNSSGVSLAEAIRAARADGVTDPIVECHEHGVRLKLSELSPIARMALEAGLDSEHSCLLLAK